MTRPANYRTSGKSLAGQEFSDALKFATAAVQDGFRAYAQAWRENELSRRE